MGKILAITDKYMDCTGNSALCAQAIKNLIVSEIEKKENKRKQLDAMGETYDAWCDEYGFETSAEMDIRLLLPLQSQALTNTQEMIRNL